MQIDPSQYRIERFPTDSMDFTDLITSGAVRSGSVSYSEDASGHEVLVIPFTPEPTAAEQWAITRRVITKDAAEEQTYKDVESAITASAAWRTGSGLTLYNTANGKTTTATATQADVRLSFTGIRDLAAQLGTVMQRQEWLAQQMLKQMNTG